MTDFSQQLWEIEQIKQLKARYFRLMDTKDWDAWRELFTDDCVHHLPGEVRHRGKPLPARVETHGSQVQVTLLEPAVGVAPGQSAVFYRGEEVLGGARIT